MTKVNGRCVYDLRRKTKQTLCNVDLEEMIRHNNSVIDTIHTCLEWDNKTHMFETISDMFESRLQYKNMETMHSVLQ